VGSRYERLGRDTGDHEPSLRVQPEKADLTGADLDEAQAAVERLNPTPSLPRRPLCRPVTGDWNGDGRDGIGVACHSGHGLTWYVMYGPYGGSPQATAGFGNGDYYQPTGGYGGPTWPGWPTG
jgi:hypothetical protein